MAKKKLLPIYRLMLEKNEIAAVTAVLRSGQISRGIMPGEIEKRFANLLGCADTVIVSSGTAALQLATAVLQLPPGSEVIVPSLSFVATAFAAEYCHLRPVFCEVEQDTFNISPEDILRKLTKKTKAVIPVHYGGYPAELSRINEIASRHGLFVIDDAAHAFGAEYGGRKIGALADLSCFSFFSTKNITSGEGGLVSTDNRAFADKIRKMRAHGIVPMSGSPKTSGYYDVKTIGYNYHLNNMGIGLLNAKLDLFEERQTKRRKNAALLSNLLSENECIETPLDKDGRHVYHLYSIRLKLGRFKVSRDDFIRALLSEGIQAGVYYRPIHLFSYFKAKYGYGRGDLPVTERVSDSIVTLPLYPSLSGEELKRIAAAVNKVTLKLRR